MEGYNFTGACAYLFIRRGEGCTDNTQGNALEKFAALEVKVQKELFRFLHRLSFDQKREYHFE